MKLILQGKKTADIYLLKVEKGSIRTMSQICSNLTIETTEQRLRIVDIVLVFPLLTLNR